MKINQTLLLLLTLSVSYLSHADQPNIIFIMADDVGWSDISTGRTNMNNPNRHYETPMLETLAEEGMSFDNAYVNGPNCAPSRSALISGQYASRPTNNVFLVKSLNRGGRNTLLLGPQQGNEGYVELTENTVTIAETLKTVGYATAHAGKYHVGWSIPGNKPEEEGFDYNYGGTSAGGPGGYHAVDGIFPGGVGARMNDYAEDYTQEYVDNNIKPYAVGVPEADMDALVGTAKNVSDALADASIEFMETEKSGPFYLQLHQYAVHTPNGTSQARTDLLAKYQNKPKVWSNASNGYGAIIEGLDQSVARIIDYLRNTDDPRNTGQKLSKNTVVFFFSDNGGRGRQADNGPLRGQKGELLEGGIRVPMIAWSENTSLVEGGVINSTPVIGTDFYTTFCEMAGADVSGLTLDGTSLLPIMADNDNVLDRESLFWHVPGYLVSGGRRLVPASIIRKGKWKLTYTYENQEFNLYDLSTDIGESTDLSAENPKLVLSMGTELLNWLEDVDAPLATIRGGKGSRQITIDGWAYTNGEITEYNNETITIEEGEQMPFVLQRPRVNIALNKTVTASSSFNNTYTPDKAVDGDLSSVESRWVSDDQVSFPQWIEVDLEEEQAISQVSFLTGYDGYNSPIIDFAFQGWNGSNWIDLVSEDNNELASYAATFNPFITDRVRLLVNESTDDFIRLYELQVFSEPWSNIIDNFEGGDTASGYGWTGDWSLSRDASVSALGVESGRYHLRMIRQGEATRDLSLYSEENLSISFDVKAFSLESNEHGVVELYDGANWNELYRLSNGDDNGEYTSQSIDLSSYTFTGTSQQLRVRIAGSGQGDYFYVDNMVISQAEVESSNARNLAEGTQLVDESSPVQIHPNPSQSMISVSGISDGGKIEIFNLNGAKVLSTYGETIDISTLPKGMYIVKPAGLEPVKFIKE